MDFRSLVVIAAAAIIAVELLLFLPMGKSMARIVFAMRKAGFAIKSNNISDHWKEKVLLRYSCELASATGSLAVMISGIVIAVLVVTGLGDHLLLPSVSSLRALLDWPGIVAASIVAALYWALRKRIAG